MNEQELKAQIEEAVDTVLDAFCEGRGWAALAEALNKLARLKGRNGRALPAIAAKSESEAVNV